MSGSNVTEGGGKHPPVPHQERDSKMWVLAQTTTFVARQRSR